eukprot:TRINITY_DN50470_c0_g1_i1.p1 TRINITY_DN50470_c0_g1~~TRINITY_DN50470_c0_g1_i1.p1  ORF type:complete len:701 (+),score=147.97 TRINITY_DN50470_c0_g1_i1:107-2209(+)
MAGSGAGRTPPPDGASRVMLVRRLPRGVTDESLREWAEGFQYDPRGADGRVCGPPRSAEVVRCVVAAQRRVGFVEFADLWCARAVMRQFVYDPASVAFPGGRSGEAPQPVLLAYSEKDTLRPSLEERRAGPVPFAAPAQSDGGATRTRLLLVVLKDPPDGIRVSEPTIDDLFWLFTQFGEVERMSYFAKNCKGQVVVQFGSPAGAELAMGYLNGTSLALGGACPVTLAIVPSKLTALTFHNQDARNRDYSDANDLLGRAISALRGAPPGPEAKAAAALVWTDGLAALGAAADGSTLPPPALPRGEMPDFIWGVHRWGDGWLEPPQAPAERGTVPSCGGGLPTGAVGDCMLIRGLPADDSFTAEHLWALAGSYGPPRAAKLLYKHPGAALVQFRSARDCDAAIRCLSGACFRDRVWDVRRSRQSNALHWSGASGDLKQRMCAESDQGCTAPPRAPEPLPPSPAVRIAGVPGFVPPTTVHELAASLGPIRGFAQVAPGDYIALFHSTDDGISAVARCNGRRVRTARGDWLLGASFSSDEFFRVRSPSARRCSSGTSASYSPSGSSTSPVTSCGPLSSATRWTPGTVCSSVSPPSHWGGRAPVLPARSPPPQPAAASVAPTVPSSSPREIHPLAAPPNTPARPQPPLRGAGCRRRLIPEEELPEGCDAPGSVVEAHLLQAPHSAARGRPTQPRQHAPRRALSC